MLTKLLQYSFFLSLLSIGFTMQQETPDTNAHYLKAQEYFQLAELCDLDTEREERLGFHSLAIKELKQGAFEDDINSIHWMMKLYKDGFYGVLKPNEQEYKELQKKLESFNPKEDQNISDELKNAKEVESNSSLQKNDLKPQFQSEKKSTASKSTKPSFDKSSSDSAEESDKIKKIQKTEQ